MSDPTTATFVRCRQPLPASAIGSVCGLPLRHDGAHGDPVAATPVWPPTSERDAHLGAYVPRPEVDETEIQTAPHVCHCACRRNWGGPCGPCTCEMTPEQMKAEADDIAARQKAEAASVKGWAVADPAPAGLTAAQEIRARLAVAWLTGTADAGEEARQVVLCWAEMCEHGSDVRANPDARPIPRQTPCPDPAIHAADLHEAARVNTRTALGLQIDALAEWIVDNVPGEPRQSEGAVATAIRVMAELRKDVQNASDSADNYCAQVEALERRRDAVLAYIADLERDLWDGAHGDLAPGFKKIRAILAGDQGEEA